MMPGIVTKKSSKLYALVLLFLSLVPSLVQGMDNEEEQDEKSLPKLLWDNKVIVTLGSLVVYKVYKFIQTQRLYSAIHNKKQPKDIKSLLKWGASASYNLYSDKETILHCAFSSYRHNKNLMPIMQILIDNAADPCKQDEKGDTIFHTAARDADTSDIYENLCSLTTQSLGKKMTLIDFARSNNILKIQNHKGELVEDIVGDKLYNIVKADSPVSKHTINLVAKIGNLIGMLVIGQSFGDDDLGIDYIYDKPKKIERLLECGANQNYCKKNKNFLHWTIDYCHNDPHLMPIMQTFINFGTDPYKQSKKGNTIFHKAAQKSINKCIAVSSLARKATPEETILMTTILMLRRRKGNDSNFFTEIPKMVILDCIFYNSLQIPRKGKLVRIATEEVLALENNNGKTVQDILVYPQNWVRILELCDTTLR